ncbi:hypothetical protein [Paenibacillus sp. yr247]|uniref:hypothetical protein n=1 Tax=Paenibacillus sp. yr247 TaxID=1761880 RepID=UPI001C3144DF|nr:hypothetical protein [Paenibacillus sp. yr247]
MKFILPGAVVIILNEHDEIMLQHRQDGSFRGNRFNNKKLTISGFSFWKRLFL